MCDTKECVRCYKESLWCLHDILVFSFSGGQRLLRWGSLDPPQEGVWLPVVQQSHGAALFHDSGKGKLRVHLASQDCMVYNPHFLEVVQYSLSSPPTPLLTLPASQFKISHLHQTLALPRVLFLSASKCSVAIRTLLKATSLSFLCSSILRLPSSLLLLSSFSTPGSRLALVVYSHIPRRPGQI